VNSNESSVKNNPNTVQVPPVSDLVVILHQTLATTFASTGKRETYPRSLHTLALLRKIRVMQILLVLELLNKNIIERVHVVQREWEDQESKHTTDAVQDCGRCQQP
jgi:hypothetical protein